MLTEGSRPRFNPASARPIPRRAYNALVYAWPYRAAQVRPVHLRGYPIRQMSCYALLRRCRLPWPRICCLHGTAPSMVPLTGDFRRRVGLLVHPTVPVLLTSRGPLPNLDISRPC